MRHFIATLPVLFLVCAWAGAQSSPTGADTRLKMLAKNRVLLDLLIDRGLELGETNDLVDRVVVTRNATLAMRDAVKSAVDTQEKDRAQELSEHLARIMADGLAVTLDAARVGVPEGSPSYERLKDIRKQIENDAQGVTTLDVGMKVKTVLTEAAAKVTAAAKGKVE